LILDCHFASPDSLTLMVTAMSKIVCEVNETTEFRVDARQFKTQAG
jgi:hypothetical protein